MNDAIFSQIDFGPIKEFLQDDNITDISYSNNGQVWLKSLDKGVFRVENPGINNELMEHEVLKYTCLSNEHAFENYAWKPKVDIDEGIQKTVDFSVKVLNKLQ